VNRIGTAKVNHLATSGFCHRFAARSATGGEEREVAITEPMPDAVGGRTSPARKAVDLEHSLVAAHPCRSPRVTPRKTGTVYRTPRRSRRHNSRRPHPAIRLA
jgi:hypothetical protein